MSKWLSWLQSTGSEPKFETGQKVLADGSRCIQCGLCGYNCPVGIQVRDYARLGMTVTDSACIYCGNCVTVCPRGALRIGNPEDAGE